MIENKKFLIFQFRRRVVLIMTGVSLTSVASCLEYIRYWKFKCSFRNAKRYDVKGTTWLAKYLKLYNYEIFVDQEIQNNVLNK